MIYSPEKKQRIIFFKFLDNLPCVCVKCVITFCIIFKILSIIHKCRLFYKDMNKTQNLLISITSTFIITIHNHKS